MSIKPNLCINKYFCCCLKASRSDSITDLIRFIYLYLKQQRSKFNSKQYFIHNNNLLLQCNGFDPFKLDYNLFKQNIQIISIKNRNLLSTMMTSTHLPLCFILIFIVVLFFPQSIYRIFRIWRRAADSDAEV